MKTGTFTVHLENGALTALRYLADREYRHVRQQAAILIRDRLIELDYLDQDGKPTEKVEDVL